MKNQAIFELYTDDNKWKYSSSPMNILKSAKKQQQQQQQQKNNETLHQVNFHSCYYWICLGNYKRIPYENFNLCEAEISLDEIVK